MPVGHNKTKNLHRENADDICYQARQARQKSGKHDKNGVRHPLTAIRVQ